MNTPVTGSVEPAEASRHLELDLPPIEVHRSRSMNPICSMRQERCGSTLHPQCATALLDNRGLFRLMQTRPQPTQGTTCNYIDELCSARPPSSPEIPTGTHTSRTEAVGAHGCGCCPPVPRRWPPTRSGAPTWPAERYPAAAGGELAPFGLAQAPCTSRRSLPQADTVRQAPDFSDVIVVGGTSACEHRVRTRSVWS
jgi:hypothetical protein